MTVPVLGGVLRFREVRELVEVFPVAVAKPDRNSGLPLPRSRSLY